MDKLELILTTIFSTLIISLFAFVLGKKKTDIEIALNYQSYYDKYLITLKLEVEELKREVYEQTKIIESQSEIIKRWENNSEKIDEYQRLLNKINLQNIERLNIAVDSILSIIK